MREGNSSSDIVLCAFGRFRPDPEVITDASVFRVHLTTYYIYGEKTGFRLLFSFHPDAEKPEKLPGGKWNCSVPNWSELLQHFPCNLKADCAAGEDEADCPYTSPLCPLGQFHYGHSCYLYVKPDELMSWNDVSADCQLRGGHLVTFNDWAEWDYVTSVLHSHNVAAVFVGLHLPEAPTLHMY